MKTRANIFARGAVVVAVMAAFGGALAQSISRPAPAGTSALVPGTATTTQSVPAQPMQAPVQPLQAPVQPMETPVQPMQPPTSSPATSPAPLPPLNSQTPGTPLTAGTGQMGGQPPTTALSVPSRADTAQTAFRALDPMNRGFVTRADTDRIAGFTGFDNADTDHDGRLTPEEFQNAWKRFAP